MRSPPSGPARSQRARTNARRSASDTKSAGVRAATKISFCEPWAFRISAMTRLAYCSPAYPAAMTNFYSYDGTLLDCRRSGTGSPLVVVPGGPGRDADYLGDLGGLAGAAGRERRILD